MRKVARQQAGWIRSCVLSVIALGLTACVSTQFAYNQLDWYLAREADHYFDLTDEQRSQVKANIAHLHRWHRTRQLSAYSAGLTELRQRIRQPLTLADAQWIEEEMSRWYQDVIEQAFPAVVSLFGSLNDEQLSHFESVLADELQDRYDYLKDEPEDVLEERQDKAVDRFVDWFGVLTDEQERLVRDHMAAIPDRGDMFKRHRADANAKLLTYLRQRPSEQELTTLLQVLWLSPEQWASESYLQGLDAAKVDTYDLIIKVHKLATDKQLAALDGKLSSFGEDFIQLAQESAQSEPTCRSHVGGRKGGARRSARDC